MIFVYFIQRIPYDFASEFEENTPVFIYSLNCENSVANIPHYRSQSWASADVDHLASVMKVIYQNGSDVKARAERARKDMCEKWTWKNACRQMNDLILKIHNG